MPLGRLDSGKDGISVKSSGAVCVRGWEGGLGVDETGWRLALNTVVQGDRSWGWRGIVGEYGELRGEYWRVFANLLFRKRFIGVQM